MADVRLTVSVSPHIRSGETTQDIMKWVLIALLPTAVRAATLFGFTGVSVMAIGVVTALFCEVIWHNLRVGKGRSRTWGALAASLVVPAGASFAGLGTAAPILTTAVMLAFIACEVWMKRKGEAPHVFDGSAAVTGLLLALVLPPRVPWWIPFVGSFVAISLGKEIFGGLGYNVFNPALVARAILLLSWPRYITAGWFKALSVDITASATSAATNAAVDATSIATPLAVARATGGAGLAGFYLPLLWENTAGCVGEVSGLLLLIGGGILIWKRIIGWEIPVTYLGTMAVLSLALGLDPVFQVLAGGALLGAIFMATDYVTSPVTSKGRLVFGVMCGALTMILRVYSKAPEGVTSAILFMNMLTPLIDRSLRPRPFGVGGSGGGKNAR